MNKRTNFFGGTEGRKVIKRVLLGVVATLLSAGAQAGTESQKLINVLNVTDTGTFISVLSPGSSASECGAFSFIVLIKDANYDTRFGMLLAAKLSGSPVTIAYATTNGACGITGVQVQ